MKRWLVISAILIAIWGILVSLTPEGWALVPINIFCLLASLAIGAFGYLPSFRQWMVGLPAWLCAIALWLVMFIGIRSLF